MNAEEKKLAREIEHIDFEMEFLQKDIRAAGNRQERDKLTSLAKDCVRMKRKRRNINQQRGVIEGMSIQMNNVKMTGKMNDCMDVITSCIEEMPNMTNYHERQNTMQKFQMQMESIKLGNESLNDVLNESEEEEEDENENAAVQQIVNDELDRGAIESIVKLPNVGSLKCNPMQQQQQQQQKHVNMNNQLQNIDEFIKKY